MGSAISGPQQLDDAARPATEILPRAAAEQERYVTEVANSTGLVAIVGLGYVGLPTALALVAAGLDVVGCDTSEARLSAIKSATVDLLDSDLARLRQFSGSRRLALTTEVATTTAADYVIICVPTPVDDH